MTVVLELTNDFLGHSHLSTPLQIKHGLKTLHLPSTLLNLTSNPFSNLSQTRTTSRNQLATILKPNGWLIDTHLCTRKIPPIGWKIHRIMGESIFPHPLCQPMASTDSKNPEILRRMDSFPIYLPPRNKFS